MKRILNFAPVVCGGGSQNSLSFLDTLAAHEEMKSGCIALVRSGSELQDLCCRHEIEHLSFQSRNLSRLVFELRCRKRFARGQTCFTIFGPPLISSQGYFLNVNGCAYSNLFYPEIPFWSNLPTAARFIQEWVDVYRRHWTAKADYWIFETAALKKRAIELCGFPESRIGVVRMAPSSLVAPDKVNAEVAVDYDRRIPTGFRLLFLADAQPNKRIGSLPAIASVIRQRGEKDFVFVTTFSERNRHTREVIARFRDLGVEMHLCNLGPVMPSRVSSLIHCVNAMGTFSRLESFSNNFIEAWRMKKPLVVTDADWARDSCGTAALYVNPENASETAEHLMNLMHSNTMAETLINEGDHQLAGYPTPAMKLIQYFQCMEEAEQLGPCPESQRSSIRWPSCKKVD